MKLVARKLLSSDIDIFEGRENFWGELRVKRVGLSVAGSRCDWSQRERWASKHGQALFGTTWRML